MPKHLVHEVATRIRTYATKVEKRYLHLRKANKPITVFQVQERALSVLVVTTGECIRLNLVSDAICHVLPMAILEHVRVPLGAR